MDSQFRPIKYVEIRETALSLMHGRMRVRVSKMAGEIGKGRRETYVQREREREYAL